MDSPSPKASSTSSVDDDWLNNLGSYEDDPLDTDYGSATLPPKVGQKSSRKKNKPDVATKKKKKKRSVEDLDLPIGVHWLMMIGTGIGGGLLGVGVWGLVSYFTGYEVGYIAILVGVLVGTGVRVGASKWDYGWGPACTAMLIAVVSIIGGKILDHQLNIREFKQEIREFNENLSENYIEFMTHDNMLISEIANEIATDWDKAGQEVNWPKELSEEDEQNFRPEDIPKTFPLEIWKEAVSRWNQLSDKEKQTKREKQKIAAEEQKEAIDELVKNLEDIDFSEISAIEGRPSAFSPYDLLWFVLACSAAFRIAAGWTDD